MEKVKSAKIGRILEKVLSDVKPNKEEIAYSTEKANELMGRLKAASPKNVEIIMAGSTARGTQTRGNSDIDIFLLFPRSADERSMEAKGLSIAKSVVDRKRGEDFEIRYAEHPYLKLFMKADAISADIVPAFKITDSSERISAVDRTQLHNVFVNSTLNSRQKDEVRILKSFLRFHNIYGAEARTQGFSGYLCELLVAHCGSFIEVLKLFASSKPPILLHFRNVTKTDDYASRFGANLIVVDPTDPNRNVAAVVSSESLARFALASRKFLAKPSLEYFYGPRYSDVNSAAKIMGINSSFGTELHYISFLLPKISEEILWQQLTRLDAALRKSLAGDGFGVVLALKGVEGNLGAIGYFTNKAKLGSKAVYGPSVSMQKNFEAFASSHKSARSFFIEGDRGIAIEKANFSTVDEALRHAIKKGGVMLPSYISRSGIKIGTGKPPENVAKPLYSSYVRLISI